jgi:hypothetical protein
VLKESEIEDAKRILPESIFRELYLAEPSEDAGNPFGVEAIRKLIQTERKRGEVCWWGIDLARGREATSDWVVAIGLNEHRDVVAFQRWQDNWEKTRLRIEAMVKMTPCCIDSSGSGDAPVEFMQKKCPNMQAFVFTKQSKQSLMEGLALAIHGGKLSYPDGLIVQELETFEYEVKIVNGRVTGVFYSAPPGLHDDCVIGLGLAVECANTAPAPMTLSVAGDAPEYEKRWESGYDEMEDESQWSPA